MEKHTPIPWNNSGLGIITAYHPGKVQIIGDVTTASTTEEEQEANANFIVRACNNHESLLDACRTALVAATETHDGDTQAERLRVIKVITEAVTKATNW